MPVPLEEVLAVESPESQARIAEMAAELRASRRPRETRNLSREEPAREQTGQRSDVAKIERRTDHDVEA